MVNANAAAKAHMAQHEIGSFDDSGNSKGVDLLAFRTARRSASAASKCWDNAVAESFFSSLKKERVRQRIYKTRELARADIFDYIEVFYNRTRRHSHLGGVSPEAFERASV